MKSLFCGCKTKCREKRILRETTTAKPTTNKPDKGSETDNTDKIILSTQETQTDQMEVPFLPSCSDEKHDRKSEKKISLEVACETDNTQISKEICEKMNQTDPSSEPPILRHRTREMRSSTIRIKKSYNSMSFRYRPINSNSQHSTSANLSYSNKFPLRRGSMIVRSSTNRNNINNNTNNNSGLHSSHHEESSSHFLFTNESLIFTPFAQVLVSLRKVRIMLMKLTGASSKNESAFGNQVSLLNIPEETINPGSEEYKTAALETLEDLEWCLQQLETIQTKRPVSNMASTKFKKLLNRELNHYHAMDRASVQISEYISQTFLDNENESKEEISEDDEEYDNEPSQPSLSVPKTLDKITTSEQATKKSALKQTPPNSAFSKGIHENSKFSRFNASQAKLETNKSPVEITYDTEDKLPPYGIPIEKVKELDEFMKNGLNNWGLDLFELHNITSGNALTTVFFRIMKERNLFRLVNIDPAIMTNYIVQLEKSYDSKVPYHNSIHAADVTQSSHVLMSAETLEDVFTDYEVFALLFSCAIHDVSHPGVTNQFLINTGHELALLYNDSSVLENYHLSVAFKLTVNKDCDIFSRLPVKQKQSLRRMIIDLVLATDMSKHVDLLADLKTMVETKRVSGSEVSDFDSYTDRLQVLQNLIHCADLSNPTKPLAIYKKWTAKIMEEFFLQGDREKELEIDISPMCDRTSVAIEKTQLSFIDLIVHPLWETWCEFVHPSSQNILDMLEENREWYESQLADEEENEAADSPIQKTIPEPDQPKD